MKFSMRELSIFCYRYLSLSQLVVNRFTNYMYIDSNFYAYASCVYSYCATHEIYKPRARFHKT